jgi:hypothetical protein
MARGRAVPPPPRSAALTIVQAREAIPKIERRIADLSSFDLSSLDEEPGSAKILALIYVLNLNRWRAYKGAWPSSAP